MNERARILSEALPYIRRYHGKTVVVKYGGSAMQKDDLKTAFARDIVLFKLAGINPVVVHGGGPQIDKALADAGKQTKFVRGLRYTDGDTMDIVEMVLGGAVNKQIVRLINGEGGRAVGITGKDGNLLEARKMRAKGDVGLVGEITGVNAEVVSLLLGEKFIPVIAPVAADGKGQTLNINADTAAAKIAVALKADSLFLLTNTAGVLDKRGKLIEELSAAHARRLLKSGVVRDGMVPKVECALDAVKGGAGSCRIINGDKQHALLLEVFTDAGAGTRITPN